MWSGVASYGTFLPSATYPETFALASERAKLLDAMLPAPNATECLMHHDYMRLRAVEVLQEQLKQFFVAAVQGAVFVTTLVASQVLTRVSRTTLSDAVQGRVTKAEFVAFWCTALNGMVALVLTSLRGLELASFEVFNRLVFTATVIVLLQYGCLVKVSNDIMRDKHGFLSERAHRLSAIVPQLPDAVTEVQPQPSLVVLSQDVLAIISGLSKAIEEQKEELEAQKARTEEQKETFQASFDQMRARIKKLEAQSNGDAITAAPDAQHDRNGSARFKSSARRMDGILNADSDRVFSTWGKLDVDKCGPEG
jgi:hypothetical protein